MADLNPCTRCNGSGTEPATRPLLVCIVVQKDNGTMGRQTEITPAPGMNRMDVLDFMLRGDGARPEFQGGAITFFSVEPLELP